MILAAVWTEKKKKIFQTQLMFCLTLCYHFLFIILNLSLYVEENVKGNTEEDKEKEFLMQDIQKLVIIGFFVVLGI